MKMKKHLTLVLSLILIVCMAMFFVACGDNNGDNGGNNPPTPPTNPTVTLSRKNLAMILGDKALLSAVITDGQDDYTLTWSTSDASIVSVDDGNIEALKQGNAQITATYSNGTNTYTDSAQIAVSLGDNVPVLFIENKTSNNWNFVSGSEFELVPFVQFNNKKFYDVALTITSSDSNVIGVEGNKLLVLAQGNAKLEVVATWRGVTFDGRNMLKIPEIDVNVVNDIQMSLNGDTVRDIQLYTRDEFYGVNYATSTPFVVSVKENGVLSNNPVDINIADERVAKYEDGVLDNVGFGETIATLTWTSSDNELFQRTIKIYVDRPIVKYDQVIENFSAADGAVMANISGSLKETTLSTLIYGSDSAVLVDATQRYIDVYTSMEVVAPLKIEDNLVKGVYSHHEGFYDVELTIGTATEQYILDVKVATKLFAQSNINEWVDTFANGNSVNFDSDYRYGYFALLEDVSGITIGSSTSVKFAGTFDGRGHVFSDIEIVGTAGLFGTASDNREVAKLHKLKGSTIKNVAFVDVTFAGTSGNYLLASSLASRSGVTFTVDNVYAQINEQDTFVQNTAALTYYCYYTVFKNVIVEYPLADTFVAPDIHNDDSYTTSYKGHGSLFSRHFTEKDGTTYYGKDVYVVSKLQLSINKYKLTPGKAPYFNSIDGSNVEDTTAHKAAGYYRYETIEDMKAANNDYTSLIESGNNCWIMVDGIPTFRSLVQSVYLKDANENELSSVMVYSTQDTFTAGIVDKNGEEIENVVISANDSRIKINGNVITVEDGFYSAMLTVSSADGIISKQFPVLVNTTTPVDFNEELLLNKADDKIYFNGTSLEGAQIYAVFYNGALVYDNDKILTSLIDKPVNTAFTLKVYTLDGCYNLTNVKMYDQVWENTKQSREAMVNFFRTTGAARTLDGYYVLAENLTFFHGAEIGKIDATYNDYEMFGKNTKLTSTLDFNVFTGTLDGRGYTLNDIGLYLNAWSGMFGIAGDGVTIKNIGFSQACHYASSLNVDYVSTIPSLMFYRTASATANVNFENVYVDLDLQGATRSKSEDGAIVFYNVEDYALGNLKWNNVVMDVNYVPTAAELEAGYEKCDKSILCGLGTINGFKAGDVVKNTYFITNGLEGNSIDDVTATADADIVKYASISDMIKANNNYDSFDSKYWNTMTGVPMWKTTKDVPYLQDADGNFVESINFDIDGATEGLTFIAGVISSSGSSNPIISCDNPNVVINGNIITVNPGVYSATIYVSTPDALTTNAYEVVVDTSVPVLFGEKVYIDKSTGKIFFNETSTPDLVATMDTSIIPATQKSNEQATFKVMVGDVKYKFTNAWVYDGVFENTHESRVQFIETFTWNSKTITGYYILLENIKFDHFTGADGAFDLSETFALNYQSRRPQANIFMATLDGRGYALEDLGVYKWHNGIFGNVGDGAVIKNIAIKNVLTNYTASENSRHGFYYSLLFNTYTSSTAKYTLENVYIENNIDFGYSSSGIYNSVLLREYPTGTANSAGDQAFTSGTFTNVIINTMQVDAEGNPVGTFDANGDITAVASSSDIRGALANINWDIKPISDDCHINNSYVITNGSLCAATMGSYYKRYATKQNSRGEYFKAYGSYQNFVYNKAEIGVATFSADYWVINADGVPVWKSLEPIA